MDRDAIIQKFNTFTDLKEATTFLVKHGFSGGEIKKLTIELGKKLGVSIIYTSTDAAEFFTTTIADIKTPITVGPTTAEIKKPGAAGKK